MQGRRDQGLCRDPLEHQAGRLGCGASGGQLSAPGFSLFPEPMAPVGAALITAEAGPALPPRGPGLESRFSSEGEGCGCDPVASVHVTDTALWGADGRFQGAPGAAARTRCVGAAGGALLSPRVPSA